MKTLVYPVVYSLLLWWFLTGAILYLNGLPRWTFKWSMAALTLMAAAAMTCLAQTAQETTLGSAYAAFTCAILLWGWQEAAFLLGYATGPRRTPCPPQARGWQRFRFAFQALLYHELALLALGVVMLAVSWGTPNPLGAWIFLILWLMRLSAKLNVFLGVRNLQDSMLPEHLYYLQSYFRHRALNALFPFSIVVSTVIAAVIWRHHFQVAGDYEASAAAFCGALLSLAILEHWFMVIPITVDGLWKWGLSSRDLK